MEVEMSANKRPRVLFVNRCFVKRDDGFFLIIRRSAMDTNNPGKWEVPGGKVDQGQSLVGAQEREVMEETGLLVRPVHELATFVSRQITTGRYKDHLYFALFSITQLVGGPLQLSEEHSAYAWVTYDELFEYDLTLEVKRAAIVLKDLLIAA
ncbi:MAG: NUDIX domain-containing protein [bacterium]|nr:NUDIX domain-containing protein [bacterium]